MPHTAFLAKLIGLFTMIVAVLVGIHKNAMLVTLGGIVQSARNTVGARIHQLRRRARDCAQP